MCTVMANIECRKSSSSHHNILIDKTTIGYHEALLAEWFLQCTRHHTNPGTTTTQIIQFQHRCGESNPRQIIQITLRYQCTTGVTNVKHTQIYYIHILVPPCRSQTGGHEKHSPTEVIFTFKGSSLLNIISPKMTHIWIADKILHI